MNSYILMVIFGMLICSTAVGSERMAVDTFEYSQSSEAQEIWEPQEGSPPVDIMPRETGQGEKALLLRCDFSRAKERCYWDREVSLDLTKFGRFSIWVYAEDPLAVQNGTIYLQSGEGWFSGWIPVEREGWQKVSFWKSDFRTEGSPEGWGNINRIRLSFWKASNTGTVVAVDDLEVFADRIMVVLGDEAIHRNSPEAESVQQFCTSMADMLEALGLEFGVVSDTDVESGALSGCKLAIFPHNPGISQQECAAIEQFVKSGGKIMLFYSLPGQLAQLLGLESGVRIQAEYPGQFSSVKLDAEAVEGLPESITQGSWNARIPKPIDAETKVVGRWIDADGKTSESPAITIHANGMFMGHVLLPDDAPRKRRMMLALLGHLVPDMRQTLSEGALQSVGRIAGFEDFDQVSEFIQTNIAPAPTDRRVEVSGYLDKTKDLLSQAERALKDNQYGKTLEMVREATDQLREAFFLSFAPREGEFRAVWCHSASGIPGWNWDKAIEHLKKNGFGVIVPNMLWAGLAYYPSKVLPVAREVEESGDQIALCLEACRRHGVQIHVWKVNWNLSRAPEEFVERMRGENRLQKDRQGNDVRWLCPSSPENFQLELDSMLEVVREYEVDGIHFDYIRYPNDNACYCSECKKRFEKDKGLEIGNWPLDVIDGEHSEDFIQWRCDQITRLVKAVSEQARKINPKVKISAAVFRDYPRCRETVGQDWVAWVESGYLDFVCPMDYTANNDQFWNLVANQLDVTKSSTPVYPGIGASAPGLPPEQVARQIHIAQTLGADGFIIFNYDLSVAAELLPALAKGLTVPSLLKEGSE